MLTRRRDYEQSMRKQEESVNEQLEVVKKECITWIEGPDGAIRHILLSPNEEFLVTGTSNGRLYQWNSQSGYLLGEYERSSESICCLYATRSEHLISISNDAFITFWDINTRIQHSLHKLTPLTSIFSSAIENNEKYIYITSSELEFYVWSIESQEFIKKMYIGYRVFRSIVRVLPFSSLLFFYSTRNGNLLLYDYESCREVINFNITEDYSDYCFTANAKFLVLWKQKSIDLCDCESLLITSHAKGDPTRPIIKISTKIDIAKASVIKCLSDSSFLIICSDDKTIRLFNIENKTIVKLEEKSWNANSCLCISEKRNNTEKTNLTVFIGHASLISVFGVQISQLAGSKEKFGSYNNLIKLVNNNYCLGITKDGFLHVMRFHTFELIFQTDYKVFSVLPINGMIYIFTTVAFETRVYIVNEECFANGLDAIIFEFEKKTACMLDSVLRDMNTIYFVYDAVCINNTNLIALYVRIGANRSILTINIDDFSVSEPVVMEKEIEHFAFDSTATKMAISFKNNHNFHILNLTNASCENFSTSNNITNLHALSSGQDAIIATEFGHINIWSFAQNCIRLHIRDHNWHINLLMVYSDDIIYVNYSNNLLVPIVINRNKKKVFSKATPGSIANVVITSDFQLAVTASNKIIQIWNISSRELISTIISDSKICTLKFFKPDIICFAVSNKGTLEFLNIKNQDRVRFEQSIIKEKVLSAAMTRSMAYIIISAENKKYFIFKFNPYNYLN
jgi:WD40 repeat protein